MKDIEKLKKECLIDMLIERRNELMKQYEIMEKRDEERIGVVDDFTLEFGTYANGIGSLIDEVQFEIESVNEEVLDEFLDVDEREEFYKRLEEKLSKTEEIIKND